MSSFFRDIRLGIIENKRWSSFEKYNLLHEVTLDEVRAFAKNLVNELKIQAIIQGNLTEKHAHDVINSVLQNINCSKIKDVSFQPLTELKNIQLKFQFPPHS